MFNCLPTMLPTDIFANSFDPDLFQNYLTSVANVFFLLLLLLFVVVVSKTGDYAFYSTALK